MIPSSGYFSAANAFANLLMLEIKEAFPWVLYFSWSFQCIGKIHLLFISFQSCMPLIVLSLTVLCTVGDHNKKGIQLSSLKHLGFVMKIKLYKNIIQFFSKAFSSVQQTVNRGPNCLSPPQIASLAAASIRRETSLRCELKISTLRITSHVRSSLNLLTSSSFTTVPGAPSEVVLRPSSVVSQRHCFIFIRILIKISVSQL